MRLVYACLRLGTGETVPDLALCSGLPERTVRYAVGWLVREGLCRRRVVLADPRRQSIELVDPA